MKPKVFLAADHAGFDMEQYIKSHLQKNGYQVEDCGASKYDAEDDYPEFMLRAAKKVSSNKGSKAIIFGGSGQGEAIVANKVKGIRAAVYNCKNLDLIRLSRTHNNANILSIGARFIGREHALKAVKLWLLTDFSGGPRHKRRLKQMENIEKNLCK
ncbi:RpiB/LacA/LacB family sugar-phosphate isomerase [Candidatus Woesearchaeota archaeon]|nr:RpiB/LacA/LacB family sugar-phosphate isomerase [Candidatus Woesearchaeota archaeon]